MSRTPGRPTGSNDTRQNLIDVARNCFVHEPYGQVSARKIAKEANVDAALIRYYFKSKAGLFEAMVKETVEPMVVAVQALIEHPEQHDPSQITHLYYKTIVKKHPDMPRMIVRILSNPSDTEPFTIVFGVLSQTIKKVQKWIETALSQHRASIRDDIDPMLAQLSFISLTIFPLIAPPIMVEKFGFKPTPMHLEKLAEHNRKVLSHGILASQSEKPSS